MKALRANVLIIQLKILIEIKSSIVVNTEMLAKNSVNKNGGWVVTPKILDCFQTGSEDLWHEYNPR